MSYIDNITVKRLVWDWSLMDTGNKTPDQLVWEEKYGYSNAGGGFRVKDATRAATAAAHRKDIPLIIELDDGAEYRFIRDVNQDLAEQIKEVLQHYGIVDIIPETFGPTPEIIEAAKRFKTNQVLLTYEDNQGIVTLDSIGRLRDYRGRMVQQPPRFTDDWIRPRADGSIWLKTKAKSGRYTWKKIYK